MQETPSGKDYIEQLKQFKDAPCEERLYVIFQETINPLSAIRGYIEILEKLRTEQIDTLTVGIDEILARLSAAEHTISTVLNTLALPEGRGRFKKSPRNEQM